MYLATSSKLKLYSRDWGKDHLWEIDLLDVYITLPSVSVRSDKEDYEGPICTLRADLDTVFFFQKSGIGWNFEIRLLGFGFGIARQFDF